MAYRVNYQKHDLTPKFVQCTACQKLNQAKNKHCANCGEPMPKKENKYHAKGRNYNGRWYDSNKEAAYAENLDWRVKAGEVKEVIPQFKIELRINDKLICNYYIDFKLIMTDGSEEYHEVKGFETELWKFKWRMTEALHPDWTLILVK